MNVDKLLGRIAQGLCILCILWGLATPGVLWDSPDYVPATIVGLGMIGFGISGIFVIESSIKGE